MREKIFYSEYFYNKVSKDSTALKKNADDFPFSSLAGFLLLYHYKKTSHPGFETMAKKMALLFNNHNWLQFQLGNTSSQNGGQELIHTTEENTSEEELQNKASEISNNLQAEISSGQNFAEELTDELSLQDADNGNNDKLNNAEETVSLVNIENLQPEYSENANESGGTEIPANNLTVNSIENGNEGKDTSPTEKDEEIAFEPMHTVDYFASQGIKISEELLQNDKLGSQMKSFTEWLRSMKKLHPLKLAEQELAEEKFIQHAANESNINSEILTEAMAEVLIKQDKKEKAIEMFSKLSLINPSKSAYFAARIESIKSS